MLEVENLTKEYFFRLEAHRTSNCDTEMNLCHIVIMVAQWLSQHSFCAVSERSLLCCNIEACR